MERRICKSKRVGPFTIGVGCNRLRDLRMSLFFALKLNQQINKKKKGSVFDNGWRFFFVGELRNWAFFELKSFKWY